MNDRFFLDTNIFVYLFDDSAPNKRSVAEELIRRGIGSGKGIVSYQVVQEFLNVASRKFPQPLRGLEAEQFLITTFKPMWAIQSSLALSSSALRLEQEFRFSWYDALIVASALEADCGILFSEDLQHGMKVEHMRIENPFIPFTKEEPAGGLRRFR